MLPIPGQYLVYSKQDEDAAAQPLIYGPIIKTFIQYALPSPPVGKTVSITQISNDSATAFFGEVYVPFGATIRPPDARGIAFLVGYDPKAQVRSREHQQIVAKILNSLILTGQLVRQPGQTAGGTWLIGYNADVPHDWAGSTAPNNLAEALDRIAAALKAAGFPP